MFRNSLLNALAPEIVSRLRLKPLEFELRHEIEFPGEPIEHIFFVESGMASATTTFEDGSQVEVGMFGYESVIGVSALMGTKRSLNRVYTEIAGNGYSCRTQDARTEFNRGETFQKLCLRYVQAQLSQAMQSTGCNAKHEVEARLARWLLLCSDRVHSDTFVMSHEFLADMLGTRRTTVSVAAFVLQHAGLISYARSHIRIMDRTGLLKRSCECYAAIKNHLDNYLEFESDIVA